MISHIFKQGTYNTMISHIFKQGTYNTMISHIFKQGAYKTMFSQTRHFCILKIPLQTSAQVNGERIRGKTPSLGEHNTPKL
jgi:hypothetical protein